MFSQREAAARCERGVRGLKALMPADVVIVVDTLSFTTCVAAEYGVSGHAPRLDGDAFVADPAP
jgi:hypothetical protein